MEFDNNEFKDDVVYNLINFLKLKGNNDEDMAFWYSDIDYSDVSNLYSLFDNEQALCFESKEADFLFLILENNKLLTIGRELPNEKLAQSIFCFTLQTNADQYIMKAKQERNGLALQLIDDNGKTIVYHPVYRTSMNKLPKKCSLTDIIKPISFEQLYERSIKSRSK